MDIDIRRKRLFFYAIMVCSAPVILLFTVIDFMEKDTAEFALDLLICAVMAASLVAVRKYKADTLVYRSMGVLLSLTYLYLTSMGAGEGTVLYWLFMFPLFYLFFLGKGEGLLYTGGFLAILGVLLLYPSSLGTHPYSIGNGLRFIAAFLFVSMIAYGLEFSRDQVVRLLNLKNKELAGEKHRMEEAIKEIRTLSGLLPICASCKSIRDDQGYWKKIEEYIGEHSDAQFSHGICPDCEKKLYPELRRHTLKSL